MTSRISRMLFPLLVFSLLGCNPSDEVNRDSQLETPPMTDDVSAVSDSSEAVDTGEDDMKEVDLSETDDASEPIVLGCGEETSFEQIEISAQCGTDEDKDGYLDSEWSAVTFENIARSPILVTFEGKVESFPSLHGLAATGVEFPEHFIYKPSDSVLTTVEITPDKPLIINEQTSSPDAQFKYSVSIGSVEYEAGEMEVLSLSCNDIGDITEEKIFGVRLFMGCYSRELAIDNIARSDMDNPEVGRRNIVVRPNYSEVNVVYTLLDFPRQRADITLFENPDKDYEVEVSIP